MSADELILKMATTINLKIMGQVLRFTFDKYTTKINVANSIALNNFMPPYLITIDAIFIGKYSN